MPKRKSQQPTVESAFAEACGLCGATQRLTKTECCSNTICDDESDYVLFSYARNSCYRNHRRQTVCGAHHGEGHSGNWKTCEECRTNYPSEMFAWWVTNEYNFEKLANPPAFRPTFCAGCHTRIILPEGGYTLSGGKYWCASCDARHPPSVPPRSRRSRGAGPLGRRMKR
jgi:hypothetical protein